MKEETLIAIIKTFIINIYTYIVFGKIINQKTKKLLIVLLYSIVSTGVYLLCKYYADNVFAIVLMYFSQSILLKFLYENHTYSIMTTNLLANAIVYIAFGTSALLHSIAFFLLKIQNIIINLILILTLTLVLIILLFNIKRFKKGFSFVKKTANGDYLDIIMINISIVIILLYCVLGKDNGNGEIVKQMLFPFIVLGIIMIIMIQKTLTLYYKQKLLEKDITEYENTIKEKDAKIEELSKEKFEISKLNHEFYNRQKALQLKVENIISNMSLEISDKLSVMNQINELSKEYTGKLEDIKHTDKLPLTNIEEVDDMFKYMQNECKKNKIDFKLTINGNIRHMVNKIISKEKLATLIGDHIRDAIIAICCSKNKFRSIVVVLEPKDKIYELSISDTGIEFKAETFAKLGLEPATTHKDRGGNGIGFITTFETLKETRGSLIIEERHPMEENDFTKTVIFRFDGKNEYKICTYRSEEIKDPNNRMIIENINEK